MENNRTSTSNVNKDSMSRWLTMYPATIGNEMRAIDPDAEKNPCRIPCGTRPTTNQL